MKKNRKKAIAVVALAALVSSACVPVMHIPGWFTMAATTTQKGITQKALYLYTGPSGSKIVKNGAYVKIAKGTTVTVSGERDGYYYITFEYNGETVNGWVVKTGVELVATPTPTPTPASKNITVTKLTIPAKCTASSLRVRTGASTNKAQLEVGGKKVTLTTNQKVTIKRQKIVNGKVWYYVKFKHTDSTTQKGYVLSDYIQLTATASSPVAASVYTTSSVKIRKKAGVSSAVLTVSNKEVSLVDGKSLKIVSETVANSKKWFKVKFTYENATRTGYLLANTVVFKASSTTTTTATPLPTATVKPTSTIIPTEIPTTTTPAAVSTPAITNTPLPVEETSTPEPTETPKTPDTVEVKRGIVNADYLNVRTGPGTTYEKLQYNGTSIQLMKGDVTTILEEKNVDGAYWYYISFLHNGMVLEGYVSGVYIDIKVENVPNTSSGYTALSSEEFEKALVAENFPESYKEALRALHEQYPLWQFQANHVGLKWNTVIEKESVLGKNLISNSKSVAWKSLESGAYDWSKDTFIAFDGTTWVAPSKEALEYYMDPRNFLNPSSMFQFQVLSYHEEYQTADRVESILKNTPMYQASYSYTVGGKKVTYSYADTFIKAAEYSGVNPYHLATRVKQEVVTSATTMSNSVSGTVTGYKGLYNFYNIGATHSTVAGGNIANGLYFAQNGTGNAKNDALFLIPWNNCYNSIVGGAKYIGNNYINKGQDTVYLQKFNVTKTSTYEHQYMANIEAPNAEAIKTYNAYAGMTDIPVEFSIPVYEDMPEVPCEAPSGGQNPNNWLKTLSVTGYTMTPTFNLTNADSQKYTITVPASVSSIKVNATAVSTLAKVSGTGTIALGTGSNTITIAVKAENGDVRNYVIQVKRK